MLVFQPNRTLFCMLDQVLMIGAINKNKDVDKIIVMEVGNKPFRLVELDGPR